MQTMACETSSCSGRFAHIQWQAPKGTAVRISSLRRTLSLRPKDQQLCPDIICVRYRLDCCRKTSVAVKLFQDSVDLPILQLWPFPESVTCPYIFKRSHSISIICWLPSIHSTFIQRSWSQYSDWKNWWISKRIDSRQKVCL